MTGPNPTAPRIRIAWLFLLLLACTEVVGSIVVRARVPDPTDWDRAAARVASEWRDGDRVVAAPSWAEPLVREAMGRALGERYGIAIAGAPGLAGVQRLWVLSIRGHDTSLIHDGAGELVEQIGRVRLERFALPPSEVRFDFVASLPEATASRSGRECRSSPGRGSGGGLGAGPVIAGTRFTCGGETVGTTVIEDLDFAGRSCIAQRPSSGDAVTLTFPAVPLGETLVIYGGLHWVDERHFIEAEHVDAPVTLRVLDGERELAALVHHDGDGWATYTVEVPEDLRGTTRALSFTVESSRSHDRSFCWAGRSIHTVSAP